MQPYALSSLCCETSHSLHHTIHFPCVCIVICMTATVHYKQTNLAYPAICVLYKDCAVVPCMHVISCVIDHWEDQVQ